MTNAKLLERINDLEQRIRTLEARPVMQPIYVPYLQPYVVPSYPYHYPSLPVFYPTITCQQGTAAGMQTGMLQNAMCNGVVS